MKLWLDDVRNPNNFGCVGWTWVKTYDEAIASLESGEVEVASLDHDIGACPDCIEKIHIGDMTTLETTFFNRCPHEKTGYDVVCWMEEHDIWPPNGVRVHSANPVGRQRMEMVIRKYYEGCL